MDEVKVEDVLALVQDAQDIRKFNLADAVKGRAFPEDTVDVFLDVESAYQLSKLNEAIIQTLDEDEIAEFDKQAKVLSDKILESKLTFHMRGIDQKKIQAIEDSVRPKEESEEDDWILDYMSALIAANITKVVDASGAIDDHTFTQKEVDELRWSLPTESWDKLVSTMQKLTMATGYFQGLTDAGFLQKS
jgi:hypothetical protein